MKHAFAILAFVGASTMLHAQRSTFSSKTEQVRVDALVLENGRPVGGLTRADFDVFDQGVAQRVELQSLDELPVDVTLALDMSDSLNGARLDRGPLRILGGDPVADADIEVTARVGITKAADWPLRWVVRGNPYVSLGRPGLVKSRRRTRR